ncbi:MAG: mannose-1-phosphate guanyltransferase [Planctomycetes bacterium]|nr:mannose-1-phosphate guanyltransferase [Planctomycetota bacterium]
MPTTFAMSSLHAVIMAGGSGTRFWPASRAVRPKQFLPLAHGKPLIEATMDRLLGLCPLDHIWIVTNRKQARMLPKLLPGFPIEQILVEPEARDTAPCVALATAMIAARDPLATMIVLPADHVIEPVAAFQQMLRRGAEIAKDNATLVTFGITPSFAATGYGYIECGQPIDSLEPQALHAVRFREKPDSATAGQFLQQGSFLWNSGIFVWTVEAIRAAMQKGSKELAAAYDQMLAGRQAQNPGKVTRAFKRAPKISIDYAVMEKAAKVAVVRATVQWDDVGSFPAIEAIGVKDAAGNFVLSHAGASLLSCQAAGNIVYAEGKRTVALFGVKDLVVVAVGDAVMVCPRDRAADLKTLVEYVKQSGRTDLL